MVTKIVGSLLFCSVALLPVQARAEMVTFTVSADGGSRAQFVSDAPLETMTGVTSNVTGTFQFDPANLGLASGEIKVDVASIRTGIDLRDEHLRGANWLDAAQFPHATFTLTRIEGARALRPNQTTNVRLVGRFSVHGRSADVRVPARVRYIPAGDPSVAGQYGIDKAVIIVNGSFNVSLPAHAVSVPTVIRLKVSDTIAVNFSLRATHSAGTLPAVRGAAAAATTPPSAAAAATPAAATTPAAPALAPARPTPARTAPVRP